MQIMPEGFSDPSPYFYDSSLYTMSGLMLIAALANVKVKPVDPKYSYPTRKIFFLFYFVIKTKGFDKKS